MTLGQPRLHLRETGSTNDRARELAAAGAPHGTLVTAGTQTAGRGRQVLETDRNVDADAEHRPALLRASLGEDAGDLAIREQDVVGPLDARVVARGLGDGDGRGQR